MFQLTKCPQNNALKFLAVGLDLMSYKDSCSHLLEEFFVCNFFFFF